eukprot:TRINITY_DN64698_c0_g1_i1.p1 TRINITY_DN64698_c0_g1~~TRINITY_DN64698_c0_g1_i1.p1  ORF type:complete len:149 (+),score=26.16 TRINITY_DN64698_c0_g1_i1:91-537(+)
MLAAAVARGSGRSSSLLPRLSAVPLGTSAARAEASPISATSSPAPPLSASSAVGGAGPLATAGPFPGSATQVRWRTCVKNSTSLLQQYYAKLPIRKKWRRAIMRGTMVLDKRNGQVKIPTLEMTGYDHRNPYRGKFENLRSPRVWFKD